MSALIYAAIVAMWAYFLIPMWLRRCDPPSPDRSSPRVRGERVLPRRPARARQDRPEERPLDMPSNPRAARPFDEHAAGDGVAARPVRHRLAVRRRVLLGLLAAQLLTAALGLAGALPAWTGLLVLVPLTAYVTHLRAEARRSPERALERSVRPAARGVPAKHAAPPATAAAFETAPAARPPGRREPELFDLAAIEAAEASDGTEAAARAATRPKAADTWDPVPVPPPTYVLKSRAPVRPPGDSGADGAGSRSGREGDGARRAVND